jgi:hypothetical protein
MSDSCLTRPWLESLSSDELIRLADRFGIDIPIGLERVFVIEQLLELALDDTSVGGKSDGEIRPDFKETTALPRQYNISFIEAMIRDPLWVFVFWEIKTHDRELHEKAPDFEGYCLRVIPLGSMSENSFAVPVGANDSAWYLCFPPDENRRLYTVELCVRREQGIIPLAVSRTFKLPVLMSQKAAGQTCHSLAVLAGADDFSLVRSVDRLSRSRRVM